MTPGKEGEARGRPKRREGKATEKDTPKSGAEGTVAGAGSESVAGKAEVREGRSALDALERGPDATEGEEPARPAEPPAGAHPSVDGLRSRFGDALVHHEVSAGDQHVVYVEASRNLEVLRWLKEEPEQRYDLLADVTAVDYGGGRPLQVVYQLWSITHRRALRVKCELSIARLEIDSATALWDTADWLEREVYDMFGVDFRGHPDLRRILMPESYAEGHPLRKDFPLRGRFSRAEQTRRALSSDPRDYYIPAELELGREAQMPEGIPPTTPDLPAEGHAFEGERERE